MVNRGFSFRLDDGGRGQTEFVMINAPINFAKSPDQMLGFLQARAPGADSKPDPEKIKAFAQANPETTEQVKYLASKPVVASWVGVNYWAIHNYTLTNAKGEKQLVKFKMVPIGGEVSLTEDEAKAKPADFLVDELNGRIQQLLDVRVVFLLRHCKLLHQTQKPYFTEDHSLGADQFSIIFSFFREWRIAAS